MTLAGANFDLRTIFDQTLAKNHPESAVTFVDNHPASSGVTVEEMVRANGLCSHSAARGRTHAYFMATTMVLSGNLPESFQDVLDKLLDIRLNLAYGEQTDYFDDAFSIGWTRQTGRWSANRCCCQQLTKLVANVCWSVWEWAGREFSDYLGNSSQIVTIVKKAGENFQWRRISQCLVCQIICISKPKRNFSLSVSHSDSYKTCYLETALFFLPTHHWRNHAHNEGSLVELAHVCECAAAKILLEALPFS